ncbi:MAG: J domain-containing protein [Sulfurimonas sp.]|nr:J domain-containing protein [Sulfurimonas sp.]
MVISLDKRAIVLKLEHDSFNLKALLYFIENSFQKVNYFSNTTVVCGEPDELSRKQYLLKWAYEICSKKFKIPLQVSIEQLMESLHLPIYIIKTNNKSIAKVVTVTIDHITSNALSITCNQHHSQIIPYLKTILKKSIIKTSWGRSLKIRIKTEDDLFRLNNILSHRTISNISVTFVTHNLDFNKLHTNSTYSQELAYKEKLQKSYKILSLTDNSTSREIKNSYRKMLRKYHPDRVYNENDDVIKLYTRRFQVVQEAYELIQEHNRAA